MKLRLLKYINEGHARSVQIKKNVFSSLLFRVGGIMCNFLSVSVLVGLLNPTRFGIWLTLSSIMGWISLLDIGLGNGLRNKLAEAITKNDLQSAKSYVSTTYAAISGIVVIVLLLFFAINPFLNWPAILNTSSNLNDELSNLVIVMFVFFTLKFISSLITSILSANQEVGINSRVDFIINFVSLTAVFFVSFNDESNSLLLVGAILSFLNFAIPLIATIWFFRNRLKSISPSFSHIRKQHLKDLSSIGLQFFFIQISAVIIFSTSNIIIIQILNAEEVTKFNITFKYFSIITLGFSIIINPFWSAFTEAYYKNDISWIKSITKTLFRFWILLTIAVFIMILISDFVYQIWIGNNLDIPFTLSILMGIFVVIGTWNNVYVYFINGIGKIRLQLYLATGMSLLNIPLSIFLVKQFGTSGAILSSIICLIPAAIMMPIQFNMIINKKATGLFNI